MALNNIDGVTAAVDMTIDIASSPTSIKCMMRLLSINMQRDVFVYDTFCSGIDEVTRMGKRRTLWQGVGFVSSGTTYSKPGSLMSLADTATLMFTFDTGCTVSGTPRCESDSNQIQANGESARTISGRFSGAVTVAWVVA